MGARQPTRLKPIAYGLPEDAMSDGLADDHGRGRAGMYLLFALVVALAVATLWYVARPALEQKPTAERSCEVVILASGSPSCVDPQSHAAAAKRGTKRCRPLRRSSKPSRVVAYDARRGVRRRAAGVPRPDP